MKFYHYTEWECFINGMWRIEKKENEETYLQIAIEFTGNHKLYGASMIRAVNEWPKTCFSNLVDSGTNKRAFIGHCGACIEKQIPEYITRMAWWHLTENQRVLANSEADKAIKLFFSKAIKYEQLKIPYAKIVS